MLAQEVFNISMALIDEYLDSGLVSAADTITYSAKTPSLLNLLQAELIKQGDLFSTYEISNFPVTNLLGSQYNPLVFEGNEFTVEGVGSAKSYFFEVDRVGTVYVEDYTTIWNTLATITTTSTPEGFTAYKGLVTPTTGSTKSRLRFSGSYYYRTINRAMFGASFALVADIPNYSRWVKHDMPVGFKSVVEIIEESPDYHNSSSYKWEGRKSLYVDYYYEGKLRIVYRPVPTTITALTDTMQLDDVVCSTVIPCGLAAHLLLQENASVASYFNGRFEELKQIAGKQPPSASEPITNIYA